MIGMVITVTTLNINFVLKNLLQFCFKFLLTDAKALYRH
jgi:hypothetical protein